MMDVTCSKCGTSPRALDRFCSQCGQRIEAGNRLVDLERKFEEMMAQNSDWDTLVVDFPETGAFFQFVLVQGAVKLDFPLANADQKAQEQKVLLTLQSAGLRPKVSTNDYGLGVVSCALQQDPRAAARTILLLGQDLYGLASQSRAEFTLMAA